MLCVQLAFYDIALAGVKDCQEMCKAASIPYERPKDYYAEMVKTDEHMLKVSRGHVLSFLRKSCAAPHLGGDAFTGQEAAAGAGRQGRSI
jgi:hypothetical protein